MCPSHAEGQNPESFAISDTQRCPSMFEKFIIKLLVSQKPIKLNLGCGLDKRKDYINIDVRKEVYPDIVLDLEKVPYPFPDNFADEILAKDVLEHFSFRNVQSILKEWHRILKPNGRIIIQTPDFDQIVQKFYNGEIEKFGDPNTPLWYKLSYFLYGGQDYPENTHKCIFTKSELTKLLQQIGFRVLKVYNDNSNMIIEAVKVKQ